MEEALTVKRITRTMPMYQFVLAMVQAVYVGFSRLHHLRFLERAPMLTDPNSSIHRKLDKDSGFHGSASGVFGDSFSSHPAEFR